MAPLLSSPLLRACQVARLAYGPPPAKHTATVTGNKRAPPRHSAAAPELILENKTHHRHQHHHDHHQKRESKTKGNKKASLG